MGNVISIVKFSLKQHENALQKLLKNRALNVLEIGKHLILVKSQLEHGQFEKWLDGNFGLEATSARRFIRVAEVFGAENKQIACFGPSALYLLSCRNTPEGAIKEALRRAKKGEQITHALAKELIEKHSGDDDLEVLRSSKSHEWYTPAQFIEAARKTMGAIDLDPASCKKANETVKAAEYFTKKQDALSLEWHGRIWLNPPYGKGVDGHSNQALWSRALIDEFEKSKTVKQAILLVNAQTAEVWFGPLWRYPLCFSKKRIHFISEEGKKSQPTHGNVFVYFGDRVDQFFENFKEFGHIVIPGGKKGMSLAR